MEFLGSIVGYVVAFFTGFFGHVVAHDFCEGTPMITKKVVEAAASRLPSSVRERYLEEWRADLLDRHGTVAKFTWAFGCLISAYKMRREAKRDRLLRTHYEVVFSNGEIVVVNVPTLAMFTAAMKMVEWFIQHPKVPNAAIGPFYLATKARSILRWRGCGNIDEFKLGVLIQNTDNADRDWKVTCYVDGVRKKQVYPARQKKPKPSKQ